MLTACAWRDIPAGAPRVVAVSARFSAAGSESGRIAVGMARQGYELQLTHYGEQGWRATFYPAGLVHSVTSAVRLSR